MSLTSNPSASEIGLVGWNLCKSALSESIPRLANALKSAKAEAPCCFCSHIFSIKFVVTPHNTNSRKDRELNEQICSMIGVVQAVVLLQETLFGFDHDY